MGLKDQFSALWPAKRMLIKLLYQPQLCNDYTNIETKKTGLLRSKKKGTLHRLLYIHNTPDKFFLLSCFHSLEISYCIPIMLKSIICISSIFMRIWSIASMLLICSMDTSIIRIENFNYGMNIKLKLWRNHPFGRFSEIFYIISYIFKIIIPQVQKTYTKCIWSTTELRIIWSTYMNNELTK